MVELFRYFGNPLRELFQSRHYVTGVSSNMQPLGSNKGGRGKTRRNVFAVRFSLSLRRGGGERLLLIHSEVANFQA